MCMQFSFSLVILITKRGNGISSLSQFYSFSISSTESLIIEFKTHWLHLHVNRFRLWQRCSSVSIQVVLTISIAFLCNLTLPFCSIFFNSLEITSRDVLSSLAISWWLISMIFFCCASFARFK